MRIISNIAKIHHKVIIVPSFSPEETGYSGRWHALYSKTIKDMRGFAIEMNPVYDTDHDPRLKNDPEKKKTVEKILMDKLKGEGAFAGNGIEKGFREFVEVDTTVIDKKKLNDMQAELAELRKLKQRKQQPTASAPAGK